MIRFENAAVGFGGKPLFENFSLHIEAGDKVLLSSPSGLGKTSILKALLGFVPLSAGRVSYNGETLEKHALWEFRKRVGYVPQNTDIGEGKVRDLMKDIWMFKAAGIPFPRQEEMAALCGRFRLPDTILEQDYEKLSGGEKQRTALIIAVALNRPIMLMDEPVSSLDDGLKTVVRDYILDRADWTVLAVSHEKEWLNSGRFRVVELENYRCRPL